MDGERHDFYFDHPGYLKSVKVKKNMMGIDYTDYETVGVEETDKEYITRLITEEFGEDHVKDIDWDNCVICDD